MKNNLDFRLKYQIKEFRLKNIDKTKKNVEEIDQNELMSNKHEKFVQH